MNEKSRSDSYAAAGVDITAGYKAVELMKQHIAWFAFRSFVFTLSSFILFSRCMFFIKITDFFLYRVQTVQQDLRTVVEQFACPCEDDVP